MGGFNPIVSGLMKGYAIAQGLREAALRQQQYELDRDREERMATAEDLRIQSVLAQAGRRVEGGVVTEDVDAGDLDVPFGRYSFALPVQGRVVRKPDKSRTAKYKTRDGRTIETELYSTEDQLTLERQRARTAAEEALRKNQVYLPGSGTVDARTLNIRNQRERDKNAQLRQEADQNFRNTNREDTQDFEREKWDKHFKLKIAEEIEKSNLRMKQDEARSNQTMAQIREREKAKTGRLASGTNLKLKAIEQTKLAGLAAAESAFKMDKDPEKLRAAKQKVQNAFENSLARLGIEVEHVEYGPIGEAQLSPDDLNHWDGYLTGRGK